jgi:hypothetical protein
LTDELRMISITPIDSSLYISLPRSRNLKAEHPGTFGELQYLSATAICAIQSSISGELEKTVDRKTTEVHSKLSTYYVRTFYCWPSLFFVIDANEAGPDAQKDAERKRQILPETAQKVVNPHGFKRSGITENAVPYEGSLHDLMSRRWGSKLLKSDY